jgi:hypothetical protein
MTKPSFPKTYKIMLVQFKYVYNILNYASLTHFEVHSVIMQQKMNEILLYEPNICLV